MNREVGFELRGFDDSCRHLLAVYTKCRRTVFKGSNLYRFKNYIFYQTVDGRWGLAGDEKSMQQGNLLLRSTQVCDDPCEPAVRWELFTGRTGEGRAGWLPCASLAVARVTFRCMHHWRKAFVARHSAPLLVQGMGPSLVSFNGFYKPSRASARFVDPNQKRWTVYEKTAPSSIAASSSSAASAASADSGAIAVATNSTAVAAVDDEHARRPARAFLFRLAGSSRWAFAEKLEDVEQVRWS